MALDEENFLRRRLNNRSSHVEMMNCQSFGEVETMRLTAPYFFAGRSAGVSRGDVRLSSARSGAASAGGFCVSMTSFVFKRLPYRATLSNISGRRVAPFSEMPAKAPRERE